MEALLSFLPMLVCPILMGVMVWMMNRQEPQHSDMQPQKSLWGELKHLALCCVNPFVVGGLALVGLGLYWAAPATLWRFAPTLLILICPLSMLLTMYTLNRTVHQTQTQVEAKETRKLS